MKIYLDLVFLLNLFFDFLILYGVCRVLKRKVKLVRLLLGSFVAATSMFLLFLSLNSLTLFLIKVFYSFLIILVTFGKGGFFKNFVYFYLIGIILGGSLYLLDISFSYNNKGVLFIDNGYQINFFLMLIVVPIIIVLYIRENINYKNTISNIYEVEIFIKDKVYKLKGMLDTGNSLVDPYKRRCVILVNSNLIEDTNNKFIYVPYKALNTSGVVRCISPSRVIINDRIFNNCLVGFSNDKFCLSDEVDCILPNKFKEDL